MHLQQLAWSRETAKHPQIRLTPWNRGWQQWVPFLDSSERVPAAAVVAPAVITEDFAAGNDCSCRNVCVGLPAQTDVLEDVEAVNVVARRRYGSHEGQ